jgi:hypothetical protein
MTPNWFFRLSLALPIVVPLPCAYHAFFTERGVLPSGLDNVVRVFAASLVIGGIPYSVFALYGLWWLGHRKTDEVVRRMFLAPLQFAGWFIVCAILYAAFIALREMSFSAAYGYFAIALIAWPFTLLLGSFYSAVVFLTYKLFRHYGLLSAPTNVA